MGTPIEKPFILEIDNTAALAFANNSANRSKLKHIDCRQEWVKMLRNKDIVKPVHINTKINLADFLTKILEAGEYERLREMVMYKASNK